MCPTADALIKCSNHEMNDAMPFATAEVMRGHHFRPSVAEHEIWGRELSPSHVMHLTKERPQTDM